MNDEKIQTKTIQLNPQREQQREWLRDQIPVVGENETIILPMQFYKKLTDQQLEILIHDIDLNLLIGGKTEKYLRRRMRRIGIAPKNHIPTVEQLDKIAQQKKAEQ